MATIRLKEKDLARLGLSVDGDEAVKVNPDAVPNHQWTLEQLEAYVLRQMPIYEALTKQPTVVLFHIGRALKLIRDRLRPKPGAWTAWQKEKQLPTTRVWEAITLFERAKEEGNVRGLPIQVAYEKWSIRKPKPSTTAEGSKRVGGGKGKDQGGGMAPVQRLTRDVLKLPTDEMRDLLDTVCHTLGVDKVQVPAEEEEAGQVIEAAPPPVPPALLQLPAPSNEEPPAPAPSNEEEPQLPAPAPAQEIKGRCPVERMLAQIAALPVDEVRELVAAMLERVGSDEARRWLRVKDDEADPIILDAADEEEPKAPPEPDGQLSAIPPQCLFYVYLCPGVTMAQLEAALNEDAAWPVWEEWGRMGRVVTGGKNARTLARLLVEGRGPIDQLDSWTNWRQPEDAPVEENQPDAAE
jgi:hypothetical protein